MEQKPASTTTLNLPICKLSWENWGPMRAEIDDFYFIGPDGSTREQFKELCDRLMRDAASDLVDQGCDPYIGYREMVFEVSQRLHLYGYRPLPTQDVSYEEGFVIRSLEDTGDWGALLGDSLEKVIKHNLASDTIAASAKIKK